MNPAVIAAAQTADFKNVRQDFLLFDTIRIGQDVPTDQAPGWFKSLEDMANSGTKLSFFDKRQESETGSAYTNMKKKTGLDWPCIFTDFGVGFFYPDPVNVDMFDGDRAAAKLFTTTLPQHMAGGMYVGGSDDKILTFRPEQAPYGYGPVGNQAGNMAGFSSITGMGDALGGNRFQFANLPLKLPKDISISVQLDATKTAKDLLLKMKEVKPIVFENGTFTNEAIIVVALRGLRAVQQVGDWHR